MTSGADRVVEALEVAEIRPDRWGRRRLAGLSPAERRFYVWILRQFAAAAPPSAAATRAAADELDLDPQQALPTLAREDLVHTDDGRPLVAYPFSANDRGHRVLVDGLRKVQAMCAIDALGIAPMLDLPIEISSGDPIGGVAIHVQLEPGGPATWQPESAVVVAGSACCDGPSFGGCCDVLHFFESQRSGERYLLERSDVRGTVISIPDAVEAGRVVFGDVLKED